MDLVSVISGAASIVTSGLKVVGLVSSSKPPSDDANRNARYKAAIADLFSQVIPQVQDLNIKESGGNIDSNFQIKTRLTQAAATYASLPVYTDLEYNDAVNVINGLINAYNKKVAEINASAQQSSQNVATGILDAMGSLVTGGSTTSSSDSATKTANSVKNILLLAGGGLLLVVLLLQLAKTFRR
jgi:hypothetical protein